MNKMGLRGKSLMLGASWMLPTMPMLFPKALDGLIIVKSTDSSRQSGANCLADGRSMTTREEMTSMKVHTQGCRHLFFWSDRLGRDPEAVQMSTADTFRLDSD